MIYIIEIFIYLIFLLNKSEGINEERLLINDPSHVYYTPYSILSSNNRQKRDQSSWLYPEIDKDRISCEQDIYDKLFTCSHLTECK
jgi:hypothetical protein